MILYDHRPLELNEDDYARVCLIPKFKVPLFHFLQVSENFICKIDNKTKDNHHIHGYSEGLSSLL